MAFDRTKAPASGSTAPTPVYTNVGGGAKSKFGGEPKFTLRYLPFGVEKDANGKAPWIYTCTIYEKVQEYDKKDGSGKEIGTTYDGKTYPDKEDPSMTQDKYALKVLGGQPVLIVHKGHRVRDFSNKPNKAADGCKWEPTDEAMTLCQLTQGKPNHFVKFFGTDAEGGTWELLKFESKEEREARKARGGGGGRLQAKDVFGNA